jgi:hypothetical protein
MASSILTPQSITQQAMKILDEAYERQRVFSLVEVTLRDNTVLGPIMIAMEPHELNSISELIRSGSSVFTLANENESILVHGADVLHIKAMRVTSKEK